MSSVSTARTARRFAVIGATTVIGLGGALVAGIAPAQAASATTSYTCNTINGPATSEATIKLKLPAKAKAGSTVAGKPFKMTVLLPAELVDTLRFFGVTSLSGDATKLGYKVGSTKVAVKDAKIPATPVPASGTMKLNLKGKSSSFKAPAVGKHSVSTPKKFTLTLKNQDGAALGDPIPCKRDKGAETEVTTLTTTKNGRHAVPERRALLIHSS